MFDTLDYYLVLTSFNSRLFLTLRLSINIKHLRYFFHSLPILTDILKFKPPIYFDPPFIKFNKDFSSNFAIDGIK